MAIFLRETDVETLTTLDMAIEAVEQAFRFQGEENADNSPRRRCRVDHSMLHVMSASLPTLGFAGLKTYLSVAGETRFAVLLYRQEGQLVAENLRVSGFLARVFRPDRRCKPFVLSVPSRPFWPIQGIRIIAKNSAKK
jgi:hypothetical protein